MAQGLPGCAEPTTLVDGRRACTTWVEGVAPLLAESCGSCHGGAAPAAQYDLTTYRGALGGGSDGEPNAVAGDVGSRLLTRLDPPQADQAHAAAPELREALRAWVVDCEVAHRSSYLHAPGVLNPVDPAFHGTVLSESGWDFAACQKCHGEAFDGGAARTACTSCHPQGPTACDTCHALPPDTGAHRAHLGGAALEAPLDCDDCHVVPGAWDAPGHLDAAPAEVSFGEVARWSLAAKAATREPVWDTVERTCSGVYCHAPHETGDPAALEPAPSWDGLAQPLGCTTCHGKPPVPHASKTCVTCHPQVVTAEHTLANPALHLDRSVTVGDGTETCTTCHGGTQGPAPPRDLSGLTTPDALGVGAHRSHLEAFHRLRGPIGCEECHAVPAALGAAGHLSDDPPAEVFPALSGVGVLARADGAVPSWDRATATCANTYCHGGGAKLGADQAADLWRTPVWTQVGVGQAGCGTCHGMPPVDPAHAGLAAGLGSCVTCHAQSVDPSGQILLEGAPGAEESHHLDGVIDVAP